MLHAALFLVQRILTLMINQGSFQKYITMLLVDNSIFQLIFCSYLAEIW